DDQGWAREAATLSWAYGFQSQAIRGQFLGMAPAALAILPQRTDSDAMNLSKASADAWVKGSMPIFCKLAVTSGELTVSTSAACSMSLMCLGVLAGAMTANQLNAIKVGKPFSTDVGTSGITDAR